jgi:hypothetical protein
MRIPALSASRDRPDRRALGHQIGVLRQRIGRREIDLRRARRIERHEADVGLAVLHALDHTLHAVRALDGERHAGAPGEPRVSSAAGPRTSLVAGSTKACTGLVAM